MRRIARSVVLNRDGQWSREMRSFTALHTCMSASRVRATPRPQKRSRVVNVKVARMKSCWQQAAAAGGWRTGLVKVVKR